MTTMTKTRSRRLAAGALAGAAALTGVGTVAASPAQSAVYCPYGGPIGNYDSGYGISSATLNIKNGPYSACNNVGALPAVETFYFHCWEANSYGNLWVYGRIEGTQIHGWTSGANFNVRLQTSGRPRCDGTGGGSG